MRSITIVVCYVRGTHEMASACLSSIQRHTHLPPDVKASVIVAAKEGELDEGLFNAVNCFDEALAVEVVEVPQKHVQDGREHGSILDRVIETEAAFSDYVLTLDSDAMPIADGWLCELLGLMTEEVCTAGILHPWIPPPENLDRKTIEWRVRSQHCWNTTHVACQLVRTADIVALRKQGIGYAGGDDTGLGVVQALKDTGKACKGFKPTRCPAPAVEFDAEFNRHSCVVYGDKIAHVGGHTRITVDGDDSVFGKAFDWAVNRVMEEGGAEFLLKPENAYIYKLDREQEVVAEKMQRLFGLKSQRLTV